MECLVSFQDPAPSSHIVQQWNTNTAKACRYILSGAHKRCEAVPRSVQHRMIAWNSDVHVLTTAAKLCPYSDRGYITATTAATQLYNYYCSDCPIWSTTERSKFLFRTSLFSIVERSLAPLCSTYGLLILSIQVTVGDS